MQPKNDLLIVKQHKSKQMTRNKFEIFISAGGTGGHIIPARCLALELSQKYQILFLGDEKYQSYIKPEDRFSSLIISSSQLERKRLKLIKAALKIGCGILHSLLLLALHRPRYVVTFGGYATFPILAAAYFTKTKIILHEQNAHLGKVNRIFAKRADKIALSFSKTSGIETLSQSKTFFVGNPIRQELIELNQIPYSLPREEKVTLPADKRMGYNIILASDFQEDEPQTKELFNILIIGGSGGAKIFSEILPKVFFNLSDDLKSRISVTQQCRKELTESTFSQYRSFNLNIEVQSFFTDMPEKIRQSHLVIARSGSSSIFEFCAAKKPMILVPFEKSADNHQEKNARFLEKYGAALVISEKEFTISNIGKTLQNLINSYETLEKMSHSAASLAVIDATKNLANLI